MASARELLSMQGPFSRYASHFDAQVQNNLLNYPSLTARNYLQLHLLVALCLLVVDVLANGFFADSLN